MIIFCLAYNALTITHNKEKVLKEGYIKEVVVSRITRGGTNKTIYEIEKAVTLMKEYYENKKE